MSQPSHKPARVFRLPLLLLPAVAALFLNCGAAGRAARPDEPNERNVVKAPELDGGVAWLEHRRPGAPEGSQRQGRRPRLLDPVLHQLHSHHARPGQAGEEVPNELVVIGVHSPKFENEKDTESIRKAILRYEISHPVVNDANREIWDAYKCESWPTPLADRPGGQPRRPTAPAKGNVRCARSKRSPSSSRCTRRRRRSTTSRSSSSWPAIQETGESPLFFPGKVLADATSNRLFIADSTHHRIVITDLQGKKIAVAGVGEPGLADGAFDKAKFNDPQGMALYGDTLYVADRKNHLPSAPST